MANRNLLVVEGAECMGKSTLVLALRDKLGWPTLHTGGPKTDELLREYYDRIEGITTPTIVDRATHLSEIVYRPVSQGKEVPADQQEELLDRFVSTRPVLILCRRAELPDLVAVERPHKTLEHWAKVVAGYPGIVARYDALFDRLSPRIPVLLYDWAVEGSWEILQAQIDFYFFDEGV